MTTAPVTDLSFQVDEGAESLSQIDEGADSSSRIDEGADSSFQADKDADSLSQIDDAAHSSSQTKEHTADNIFQSACRVIADPAEGVSTVDTLTTQSQESCLNVIEIDDLLIG